MKLFFNLVASGKKGRKNLLFLIVHLPAVTLPFQDFDCQNNVFASLAS